MDHPENLSDLAARLQQCLDEAVFSSQPLEEVLDLVMHSALELLHAEYGSLHRMNYRGNALELLAIKSVSGVSPPASSHQFLPLTREGVVTTVFNSRKALNIPDIRQFAHYIPLDDRTEVRSELAVPLYTSDGQGVMGVLNVESPRLEAFTKHDQTQLEALARRAASVMQRALLAKHLQEVSHKLLHLPPQALLDATVSALADLLCVPVCAVWRVDLATDGLVLAAAVGRQPARSGTLDGWLPRQQSFLGKVLESKAPKATRNVLKESDFVARELAEQAGWVSALAIPVLAADGEPLGVTCVYAKQERTFTEQEQGLALAFADQVAVAFQQARLHAAQARRAAQDRVLHAIFTASMKLSDTASVSLSDIDTFLDTVALAIHREFGYRVDLGMLETDYLVLKTTVLYDGTVERDRLRLQRHEGITGEVVETGRSQMVPDVHDPSVADVYVPDSPETLSELAVALQRANGQTIGVLNVESRERYNFAQADIELFESIAQGLTLAIDNAQRLKELSALHKLAITISQAPAFSQAPALQQLLATITATVCDLFQAQACALYFQDTVTQTLILHSHRGLPEAVERRVSRLEPGKGIAGAVFASGQPMVVEDLWQEPRVEGLITPGEPLRSLMAVPIATPAERLGVVTVITATRQLFTAHDVQLLELIGQVITQTIDKAQGIDQYHRLYYDAPDPMFTLDRERRITDINHCAVQVLGYTREELLGTDLMEFWANTAEATQAHARFARVVRGEDVPLMEFELRRRDHSTLVIESNFTPIRNHFGDIVAVQAIWRDITARSRARREVTDTLSTILELSSQAFDPFTSSNDRLLQEVAVRTKSLLYSAACTVHITGDDDALEQIYPALSPKASSLNALHHYRREIEFLTRVVQQGHGVFLNFVPRVPSPPYLPSALGDAPQHVLCQPIRTSQGCLGVLSVARSKAYDGYVAQDAPPYTEADRLSLALLATIVAQHLEHKRLAQAAHAQRAAEITVQQVHALGVALAHKVPGLLTNIVALTTRIDSTLQTQFLEASLALESDMIHIRLQNSRATHLIEQYRRLTHRLPSRLPKTTQSVSLATVIQSTTALLGLPSSTVTLQCESLDALPPVQTDPAFLTEVLEGLLNNACEAMQYHGRITISGIHFPDQTMVELRVHDTGPGVKPEVRASLFSAFNSTKDASDGLGLGLWFSHWGLRALGGDLALAQTPLPGATFLLRLPTAEPIFPAFHRFPSQQETTPAQPQVLLVDDDETWRYLLMAPFTSRQWQVHGAASKDEALQLLESQKFTAFVVDVMLAENQQHNRDGLEVVEAIRSRWPALPGLLVSIGETSLAEARARFHGYDHLEFMYKNSDLGPYETYVAKLTTQDNVFPRFPSPPASQSALREPTTQSHRRVGTPPETILVVENDATWQELVRGWCEQMGFTVVQEWDVTAARHRLTTLVPPPVLAIVDLRLHPTDPYHYDGLSLLQDFSNRGIYTLVVSHYIPDISDSRLEQPGILELITKGYVPPEAFMSKICQAIAHAAAARHAEGQCPEQRARLHDLPLGPTSQV